MRRLFESTAKYSFTTYMHSAHIDGNICVDEEWDNYIPICYTKQRILYPNKNVMWIQTTSFASGDRFVFSFWQFGSASQRRFSNSKIEYKFKIDCMNIIKIRSDQLRWLLSWLLVRWQFYYLLFAVYEPPILSIFLSLSCVTLFVRKESQQQRKSVKYWLFYWLDRRRRHTFVQ